MKSTEEVKSGSLLISMPFLGDPNFERTVILICEHNEEGSFGLILNQESEFMIQDFDLFDNLSFDTKVFIGGPVQHNTIHFLHQYELIEMGLKIASNVYWGGVFDDLKDKVEKGEILKEHIQFYLGYSGWEPGQIEEEINRNSWVVFNDYTIDIFKSNPNNLWKSVLKEKGGKYAELANYPIDPSLN